MIDRFTSRMLAAGAIAAALSLSTAPVQAQSLTQSIFSRLLGTNTDEPAVNYSERAPLVIPPKRDMVTPQDKAALEADPAWPKDPDVEKRRKKASADSRGPASSNSELLSNEEMAAGTLTSPGRDQRSGIEADREYEKMSNPVSPKVLAKRGSFSHSDDTPLDPSVCPTRKSLIDPPDCLNRPLASAPLDGNEPLPSEASIEANKPWYEKVWKFGGGD